ncbi:hypothetical protein L0F63_006860 [Massospora cicadina]|nr:hypothetical protein L0F63_006860 [Massospora cicadina]
MLTLEETFMGASCPQSEGIMVWPLVNGSVIRHIVPGNYYHGSSRNLQVQVVVGKETRLELIHVDIFPPHISTLSRQLSVVDETDPKNGSVLRLGDELIKFPDLRHKSLLEVPVFGTIKDIHVLAGANFEIGSPLGSRPVDLILVVSDSGTLSILKVDVEIGWADRVPAENVDQLPCRPRFAVVREGRGWDTLSGRAIAVDQQSRSFAVAAWLNQFRVFFLPKDLMACELASAAIDGRTFPLPGILWGMTYLYPIPSTSGVARPVLVLIAFDDVAKRAQLVMYEFFQLGEPNAQMSTQVSRLPLGNSTLAGGRVLSFVVSGDGLPLYLIPLAFHPEGLVVVTETQLLFVTSDHIASGDVAFPRLDLPPAPGGTQPGLITGFACPDASDVVYLGTERGLLYRLRVAPGDATHPLRLSLLGRVSGAALGGSLAVLASVDGWDLLGYPGDFSDGGLVWAARDAETLAPIPGQRFANWAPILDFGHLPTPDIRDRFEYPLSPDLGLAPMAETRQLSPQLYTCAGVHPHGSVHCLRMGHLATEVSLIAPLPAPVWRMFSFHFRGREVACLSFANATRVLADQGGLEDMTETWALSGETSSILVSCLEREGKEALVQVTPERVLISDGDICTPWPLDVGRLAVAAAHGSLVGVASSLRLVVNRLLPGGSGLELVADKELPNEPTCLAVVDGLNLVVVGTHLPGLSLFSLNGGVGYELDLRDGGPGLSAPSSLLFHPETDQLLVGLVDGVVLKFRWGGGLKLQERWRFGRLPVSLARLSPSQVLATSDSLNLISLSPSVASFERVLWQMSGVILDAVPFPPSPNPRSLGILCATLAQAQGCQLFGASVDPHPATHAHKLKVQGTPRRLHSNDAVGCLVVLVALPGDASAVQVMERDSGALRCQHRLPRGEVAYCCLLWEPVATSPFPNITRSLYFVGVKGPNGGAIVSLLLHETKGNLSLIEVGRQPTDQMVYCLERLGGELLVAGSDTSIVTFLPIHDDELRKVRLEQIETRSVGAEILALSASQGTLAVATQPFSGLTFKLNGAKALEFVNSARHSRRAVSCVQLDAALSLGCDRVGGSVFGLANPSLDPPPGDAPWKVQPGADEFFSFYLGEGTVRLRQVQSKSSWAVIGCTMLGTIFAVAPVEGDFVGPLLELQGALSTSPLTRPLLGNDYQLYRSQASMAPSVAVLDGWLLNQFPLLSFDQQRQLIASSPQLSRLTLQPPLGDASLDSLISYLHERIRSLGGWPH